MLTQNREYEVIFAYLRSINFHFLDTWVIECINYYKSIKPNISLEDLKNEVKQQWLLADLREIKVPSLPPMLASKEKTILQGKYAVQVETMIDCSESCYSQFQKLRKICTENLEVTNEKKEWEIKSKRCLTFKICDGVQELQAMEYQPIKKIRNNDPELLPGFKMIIIGPVECRKGMILLKDENVRICGGEVDTLTISSNLKSILIQKLEINEEDYPEEFENSDTENGQFDSTPNTQMCDDQSVANLLSENDDIFLSLPLEPESLVQQTPPRAISSTLPSQISNNEYEDEDIFISSNKKPCTSDTRSNETQMSLDNSVQNTQTNSDFNAQTELDIDPMELEEIFIEDSPPCSSMSKSKIHIQTKLPLFFKNNPTPPPTRSCVTVDCEPFVYLKQIMSVKLKKPVIFTIKVIILTLTKKITIDNDEYNLKANVTDGSMAVNVEFSSAVVEDLLDFSPCEMISMMKVKNTNSAIAGRIKESFSRAQEKLISLNCLMKVKFFPNERIPLVLSLEEVNSYHVEALMKRQTSN